MCIGPTESLISTWTSEPGKTKPIAIAAVLYDDTSAIITKKSSGINSIGKLDGKKYASYEGRFEMAIIKQMIRNNCGSGDVIEIIPSKLDCFDAVLRDDADATWIFQSWEGLMHKKEELNIFPISATICPYGYSPLLLAHPAFLEHGNLARNFLKVTTRGYQFALSNPSDAAECLFNEANHESLHKLGLEFLVESTMFLSFKGHYVDPSTNKWGYMKEEVMKTFFDWLTDNELLTFRDGKTVKATDLPLSYMFTNAFLDN